MIQLIALDGYLSTPREAASAELLKWIFNEDEPVILADRNEHGEAVTARWPRPNKENLRMLLYGARETGQIPGDTRSVLLPSGKEFTIDS